MLASEWEKCGGVIGDDTVWVISSGRHRLVAILTYLDLSGNMPQDYLSVLMGVVIKVVDCVETLKSLILANNGSRTVGRPEKTHMKISAPLNVTENSVKTAEGIIIPENMFDSVVKALELNTVTFAQALGNALGNLQSVNRCFKFHGVNISLYSLSQIASKFTTMAFSSKAEQSIANLEKATLAIALYLPEVCESDEMAPNWKQSHAKFHKKVAELLADNVVI